MFKYLLHSPLVSQYSVLLDQDLVLVGFVVVEVVLLIILLLLVQM